MTTEIIFGNPDERLPLRHEAGSGAGPYVAGTLLAIRETSKRVGVTRGLDTFALLSGANRTSAHARMGMTGAPMADADVIPG